MCTNKDIVLNEKNNSHFLSEKQHPMKINKSTGSAGKNLHCGKIGLVNSSLLFVSLLSLFCDKNNNDDDDDNNN